MILIIQILMYFLQFFNQSDKNEINENEFIDDFDQFVLV